MPDSTPSTQAGWPQRSAPPGSTVVLCLVIGVIALGVGFGAVKLQEHFAPVGLFPLLIGVCTGLAVGAVWSAQLDRPKRRVLVSALVAGLICVGTIHYGSYLVAHYADRQRQRDIPAEVQLIDPDIQRRTATADDFGDYMDRAVRRGRKIGALQVSDGRLILWWVLDGLVIVSAAMFAATIAAKPTSAGDEVNDDKRGNVQGDSGAAT